MTFGEACRKLRAAGYTNLWSLELWRSSCNGGKEPPVTMTDEYIARKEQRGAEHGEWDVDDHTLVFVRRADGARFRVYSAA